MENKNISDLEKLPYDVFAHLIDIGKIENEDLVRLCISSPILNNYCNKNKQLIFKKALNRTYNVTEIGNMKPRQFLKYFKFSYMNNIVDINKHRRIIIKFLVPNIVIDKFADSLGVTTSRLLKSQIFKDILVQHYIVGGDSHGNNGMYHYNTDIPLVADLPNTVSEPKIPIIYSSKEEEAKDVLKPVLNRAKPGGHGNFIVDNRGRIVQIKNKFGSYTDDFLDIPQDWIKESHKYPSIESAKEEAFNVSFYESAKFQFGSNFNRIILNPTTIYVIRGIIIFEDQIRKLKHDLEETSDYTEEFINQYSSDDE